MAANRSLGVLAALCLAAAAHAADDKTGFTGEVLQAVDGGTLLVRPKGEKKPVTVKLIGLQAPAKATREKDGQEPWGTRSQQFLALEVVRETVRVEFDVRKSEAGEKELWGYVWVEADGKERLVNEVALAEGHAVLDSRPPNVQYADRLADAQKAAREGKKNVWNPKEPLPETPAEFARKEKEEEKTPDVPTLKEWKEGCVIGNKKTKKFHVPGGRYYDDAKGSKNAVYFATTGDAVKAGYVQAAR